MFSLLNACRAAGSRDVQGLASVPACWTFRELNICVNNLRVSFSWRSHFAVVFCAQTWTFLGLERLKTLALFMYNLSLSSRLNLAR